MKRFFYAASALAYLLLAAPAHGLDTICDGDGCVRAYSQDVLMGPRVRAMIAQAQAASSPTDATPTTNTAEAPASKADQAATAAAANFNADPPHVSITAGYSLEITGDGPTQARPETWIEGEMPISVGGTPIMRGGLRLGLIPTTGQTTADPTLTTLTNYGAVEFGGWVGRVIGRTQVTDSITVVKTAVIFEAGGRTVHGEPDPAKRFLPYWCSGFKFTVGDSQVTVCAGQDDLVGEHGGLQIDTYGNLAIPKTNGIGNIGWDVAIPASNLHPLPVGQAPPGQPPITPLNQHAVIRLTAYADVLTAIQAIFNKGAP